MPDVLQEFLIIKITQSCKWKNKKNWGSEKLRNVDLYNSKVTRISPFRHTKTKKRQSSIEEKEKAVN